MPRIIACHAATLPIVALIGAVAVGAWLGFSSCGGYVWQTYFGYSVLVLAVLAVLLGSGGIAKSTGLATVVVGAFLVARGVGFASYVGADGPGEYLQKLLSTFSVGLC